MDIVRKIKKGKKGQQLVEMAFVLPVIILCLGVLITAGQLIFAKMTCQMAAYEGARKAVVVDNYYQAKQVAIQKSAEVLKNGIGLKNPQYVFNANPGNWKKGNYLDYTVSADVKTLFPVPDTRFKANSTTRVSGHIVMMIERD